jgi:EKC/KEOPS complex subunit CGI121/TPRKB
LTVNHLLAAAFRAVNAADKRRLKSRNVHSEMVFSFSPNNNVSL